MEKEEIFLSDWKRILIGNAPLTFMLEVALRTLIIYLVLVVIMRLMGKRMNAQLTITELAIMIMLGGIVSTPMQVPERGLVPGIIILVCVLFLLRGINWLAFKYRPVELIVQGDVLDLVKNGQLVRENMVKSRISREQLFANLRSQQIMHLGQVKRVYLEACGKFSVFRQAQPRPGLSVLPEKDAAIHQAEPQDGQLNACLQCGHVEPKANTANQICPNCSCPDWTYAVK